MVEMLEDSETHARPVVDSSNVSPRVGGSAEECEGNRVPASDGVSSASGRLSFLLSVLALLHCLFCSPTVIFSIAGVPSE
jgi:hypothetical protein